MRVPSLLKRGSVGFNMTPMIDVVFLLIIFFLVSSHLAKQESRLELPLPVAETGREPDLADKPRVIVNVLADGRLMLTGQEVGRAELARRLRRQLQQDGEDLEVKVRGDRGVLYRHVQGALLACTEAGVWNFNLSVYRPEDVR